MSGEGHCASWQTGNGEARMTCQDCSRGSIRFVSDDTSVFQTLHEFECPKVDAEEDSSINLVLSGAILLTAVAIIA